MFLASLNTRKINFFRRIHAWSRLLPQPATVARLLAVSGTAGVLLRCAETNVSHKSVAEVLVRFTATVGVCGPRWPGRAINIATRYQSSLTVA